MKKETEQKTVDHDSGSARGADMITEEKNSNRPFRKECGDCFYNDGTCKDDPKTCCYLINEIPNAKAVSNDHHSPKAIHEHGDK